MRPGCKQALTPDTTHRSIDTRLRIIRSLALQIIMNVIDQVNYATYSLMHLGFTWGQNLNSDSEALHIYHDIGEFVD